MRALLPRTEVVFPPLLEALFILSTGEEPVQSAAWESPGKAGVDRTAATILETEAKHQVSYGASRRILRCALNAGSFGRWLQAEMPRWEDNVVMMLMFKSTLTGVTTI